MPRSRTRYVKDRSENIVHYDAGLYAAAVMAASRLGMSPADFFDEALLDRLRKAGPEAARRRYDAAYVDFRYGHGPRPYDYEFPPDDFIPPSHRGPSPRL